MDTSPVVEDNMDEVGDVAETEFEGGGSQNHREWCTFTITRTTDGWMGMISDIIVQAENHVGWQASILSKNFGRKQGGSQRRKYLVKWREWNTKEAKKWGTLNTIYPNNHLVKKLWA